MEIFKAQTENQGQDLELDYIHGEVTFIVVKDHKPKLFSFVVTKKSWFANLSGLLTKLIFGN